MLRMVGFMVKIPCHRDSGDCSSGFCAVQRTPLEGSNNVEVITDSLAYFVILLISAGFPSMYCSHYLGEKIATLRDDLILLKV